MKPELLRQGDWIAMKYGYSDAAWYVVENRAAERRVRLGSAQWLFRDAMWLEYDFLEGASRNTRVIGRTKPRWWWRWLPSDLRDMVCPFPVVKVPSDQVRLPVEAAL